MRRYRLKSAIGVDPARGKVGNLHEVLRLAFVGGVVTLMFAALAALGLPSVAQAGPVKPTVSSFAATPSSRIPPVARSFCQLR